MLNDEQQKHKRYELQSQYALLEEKILNLRKEKITQTDPKIKFQLDQDIKKDEAEQDKITQEIAEIDQQLTRVYQPPVAINPPNAPSKISRKQFLKWFGFGGVSLVTALVIRELFQTAQTQTLSLQTFSFETITVDAKGKIVKSSPGKAEFFTEDLGNSVTLEMVKIPGGSFLMGTEDKEIEKLAKRFPNKNFDRERRQYPKTVQSFYIGKFEVTQEQYKQVMGTIPPELQQQPNLKFQGDKHPIIFVYWDDAVEFCKKLSQKTGRNYRLPTEAEWEYAARAGTTTPFHFGETITGGLANYRSTETFADELKEEFRNRTTPVGQLYPNAFGLYDIHGNVWEWIDNNDKYRVLRGCSWGSEPLYCRSAHRSTGPDPKLYRDGRGFRVLCNIT